ncbi:hypothetical protein [Streptomyces sp. NPDC007264]|uniref:hypothetical protein n=1 Tax=Streptomyces sp. NPDC007264 TaxID=3364777 RepID=UPI0036D8DE25
MMRSRGGVTEREGVRLVLAARAALLGAGLLLTGCDGGGLPVDGSPSGSGAPADDGRAASPLDNPDGTKPGLAAITSAADRATARGLIEKVATKGRGPRTGYDRDEFGYAWTDSAPGGVPYSHNGCDSRIISMPRAVMDLFSQRMQGVVGCA